MARAGRCPSAWTVGDAAHRSAAQDGGRRAMKKVSHDAELSLWSLLVAARGRVSRSLNPGRGVRLWLPLALAGSLVLAACSPAAQPAATPATAPAATAPTAAAPTAAAKPATPATPVAA